MVSRNAETDLEMTVWLESVPDLPEGRCQAAGCETRGAQGYWQVPCGIKQAKQDTPVGLSRMLVKEVCSVGLCNPPQLFVNLLLFLPLLETETQSLFHVNERAFFQARKKGLIQVEERETFFVTYYKVSPPLERGLTPLARGSWRGWQGSRTNA